MKNTKSKTREKLPEGMGKTWSIRGVPNDAITAARLYSAQDEMFLGAWVGAVILREVAQRTDKNNKKEIARPEDVVSQFSERLDKQEAENAKFMNFVVQHIIEQKDKKLINRVKRALGWKQ